jgi:hypothetical protein
MVAFDFDFGSGASRLAAFFGFHFFGAKSSRFSSRGINLFKSREDKVIKEETLISNSVVHQRPSIGNATATTCSSFIKTNIISFQPMNHSLFEIVFCLHSPQFVVSSLLVQTLSLSVST